MFKNLKKTFSTFMLISITVLSVMSFSQAAFADEIKSLEDVQAVLEAETVESVMTISDEVDLYFFWGDGCPHCEEEAAFLEDLQDEYDELNVFSYEVWYNDENRTLLEEMSGALGAQVSGVPFTIIGDDYISGYLNDKTTGAAIEALVVAAIEGGTEPLDFSGVISVPFIGTVDVERFSLPVITFILGGLDGFNPCAMWTLIFLITLLLGMEDRKRMWILGSAFIVASAFIYFLFMAAWLNLILFLGFIVWVRIVIGLIALAGGGYNLKEYFTNKDATCKVTGTEKRQRVFAKLRALTHEKSFWMAFVGIILLAFAVNLVELVCSAGLPAVYTQILALNDLTTFQHYAYLLFYIFIFMLDDLIVFFVAMATLKLTGMTTKYTRWSHLIGGVLMLLLGALLIFKPEWLFFG